MNGQPETYLSKCAIDTAINEAMDLVPEAFSDDLSETNYIAERRVIGEREAIAVSNVNDVFKIIEEHKSDEKYGIIEIEGWYPEKCAYYRSFHFRPKNWGVFINLKCLISLSRDLMKTSNADFYECLKFVWKKLLYHEKYHYKVDLFSMMAESCLKMPIYIHYKHQVYDPTFLSNDNIEEGLANAFAFKSVRHVPSKKNYLVMKKWLTGLLDHSPPGYNQYQKYLGNNFRVAESQLVSQVLSASLSKTSCNNPLQDFMINSSHKFWNLEKDNKVYLCV